MKILKIFAALFISLSFITNASACGGGWYDASYSNIYEIRLMLHGGNLGITYHNQKEDFTGSAVGDNLKEWSIFFEGKYETVQISDWIYTEEDFANVRKINSDLSGFSPEKRAAFVDYISLAKKAETISNAYDPWGYSRDDEPLNDLGFINKLTKDIASKQKTITNEFLNERYTFQLVKLYYYSKRYDKAISTYDSFYNSNKSKSIMKYWGLEHKAGAQMQSGDTVTANYNFLQVFNNYPGRRHKSYHSMVFSNERQFSQTLEVCKTKEDKAAFYFIRGVNKNSVVLEDLKACFTNAPNSEYAKVLMANELVKMEHIFWNKDSEGNYWEDDVEDMPLEQLHDYVGDFIVFGKKAVEQANDKSFWQISLAYLYSLHKDFENSEKVLKSITTSKEEYRKQIKAIHLLNYVHQHDKFGPKEENELGEMWLNYNGGSAVLDKNKWGAYGTINSYLADYLESYYSEKDPLKSFLFSGETISDFTVEYETKLDADQVHELRLSLAKADKTALQSFGEKCFLSHSQSKDINATLLEVEATLLMRDPSTLEDAVQYFGELESTVQVPTNPFNMNIRDCIWGGWSDENSCQHKTGNFTKLSLAKKLLEMRKLATNNNSAMDYYLLGNAYYNMTYFGHAYEALSYYRSGSSYTGFDDCSAALEMYQNAIPLFNDNREMQAKAVFMAAKCEQNLYFLELEYSSDYGYWGIDVDYDNPKQGIIDYNAEISAAGYREYFELLKDDYKDTKFYQEVIEECSYFDLYVHY